MLVSWILQAIVAGITAITGLLPSVTSLPSIGGVDIDTILVQNIGYAYRYAYYVWPVYDVFIGAAVIWTYYGLKVLLKLILGSRAPGHAH